MLCYVVWNLFTVGSSQFFNDDFFNDFLTSSSEAN